MAIRAVTATARGSFISSQHDNRYSFLSLHPPRPHHNQGFGRSRPSTSTSTSVFIHLEPTGPRPHRRLELLLTTPRAADSTQPSSVSSSAGKTIVPDDQFSLAKVCICLLPMGVMAQKFFIWTSFSFFWEFSRYVRGENFNAFETMDIRTEISCTRIYLLEKYASIGANASCLLSHYSLIASYSHFYIQMGRHLD